MERIKKFLSGFLVVFLVVLLAINVMATILLYDQIKTINNQIGHIEDKIALMEVDRVREETLSEAKIIELYKEVNDRTNEAIDRVLTIVGLVAGIVTFFSLLLAYKAPHDVEKRIDNLNELINDTTLATEEAKYQALISSAMAKPTRYEAIKKLNELIHKYPDKPDAYIFRGFMYDDIKKYDRAITDYETAKKLGCDLTTYYNSMGVAYSNKGEQKKAIAFYTKAINMDSDDCNYYCNRACSYDDEGDFESALRDFEKAIEIDSDSYEAYFNRNFTYDKLWRRESDRTKQIEYIQKRKEDLEKAIELNPDSDVAPKLLKKFIKELIEKGFLVSQDFVIAKIDENIADLNFEINNIKEALQYYEDAFDFYIKETIINENNNYDEDVNRIGNKIVELIVSKNEVEDIVVGEKDNPALVSFIASAAYQNYVSDNKINAEILFRTILPYGNSALNLAFMKRREETINTPETVSELLDMEEDKNSMIWCMNKALYLIEPDKESSWYDAIEVLKNGCGEIESVVEWWSQKQIVGEKENKIVFLLLALANLYDDNSLNVLNRIKLVENYGYNIPEEFKQ